MELSYENVRSLVVEALNSTSAGQIIPLTNQVMQLAQQRGLIPDPNAAQSGGFYGVQRVGYYDPGAGAREQAQVRSILWDLLIEGVVRPGLNDGMNNDLPFYHVTEYGRHVLANGPNSPYDPDGYLKRLQSDIPTVDPVIISYLNESLRTFRIGCLLSATVTIGCASEKAFLLLVEAYASALPKTQQEKFRKDTEGRMIKRQFEEFNKRLESHLKPKLPNDLKDDLDVILNGVFSLMRNLRNDAGHPTGKQVEREVVYTNLVIFLTYLRKIYALISWLANNQPL